MPYRPPEPIARALIDERFQISQVIANAVDYSFRAAFHSLHTQVGEVEKLIYFFMEGLPVIEDGINRCLAPHGVSVTVSGILCHQTPKVQSTSLGTRPDRCELGDIAFVSTYGGPIGRVNEGWGNAVLMQAKDDFHPGVADIQEQLYEVSDEFKYTSPAPLSGQVRSLSSARGCLYYWDFNCIYPPFWHPHRAAIKFSTGAILARPKTIHGIHFSECFERMLADLFCGIGGRGIQRAPTGNGWSQIIHDLIINSSTRSIRHKRIFGKRKRGPGRLSNYLQGMANASGPAPSFIRCSLGEFLNELPDEDIRVVGRQLEREAAEFKDEDSRENESSRSDSRNEPPPPLSRGNESDNESGGGSFIVFQFKETK